MTDTLTEVGLKMATTDCAPVASHIRRRRAKRTERVIIYVRGRRFETRLSTLERYPDTLLGTASGRAPYYNKDKNIFELDRDPDMFELVLFYYQSGGILAKPMFVGQETFEEELLHFQIKKPFGDFAAAQISQSQSESTPFNGRLRLVLENPKSSTLAKVYSFFIITASLLSVGFYCAETFKEVARNKHSSIARTIRYYDYFFTAILIADYAARFICAPDRRRFSGSLVSILDLTCLIPALLNIIFSSWPISPRGLMSCIKVARMLQILKLTRYSSGIRLLLITFGRCTNEILAMSTCILIALVTFSYLLYQFESNNVKPDPNFSSVPATFWYTMITLCTVGYGDVVPRTVWGKLAASFCMVCGVVLLMALPSPVFITRFIEVFGKHQQKKMLERRRR